MDLKNKISLIIFDMDGLMFDTERLAISAWQKAGMKFGYNIKSSFYIETSGIKIENTEIIFKKHFGADFPFYEIEKLKEKYLLYEIEKKGLPIKNGLFKLLKYLKTKKVSQAIATSTRREIAEKYLSYANIGKEFNIIMCGDDVEKGKPEPDIFLAVARKIDCIPEKCIVLEDSVNGILAAHRANMIPILVSDINEPDERISRVIYRKFYSLLEVKDFLNNQVFI